MISGSLTNWLILQQKNASKSWGCKLFVKEKGYNEAICFFVDMSLPSGQNRLFVYDFRRYAAKFRARYSWPL